MPCKKPNLDKPFECHHEVKNGTAAADGVDHVWPQSGHLIIERCERYCWYCFVKKGQLKRWSNPWYLRRHVIDVHAEKTHPYLTCSMGWKNSENGNRKPWQEEGVPAPMGRRAVKKTPEPESEPEKPQPPKKAQTPERKQKRQVQKKKKNAATATPRSNVHSEENTPSPPALTINTPFSSPGGQLPLPDGFNLTQTYGLGNTNNMSTTMGNNNKMAMAMLGNDFSNTFAGIDFDGVFANDYNDGQGVGADFCQQTIDPTQVMFDDTMRGLDEANNILPATESFTSSDTTNIENEIFDQIFSQTDVYDNDENVTDYTGYQFGVVEPTGTESLLYGTDGTIEPTSPTGGKATGLSSALGEVIYDRIAKGELSEVQALSVLHKLTKKLEGGEQ